MTLGDPGYSMSPRICCVPVCPPGENQLARLQGKVTAHKAEKED